MNPIDKVAWILIKDRKVLYVRSRGSELFYNAGGKREANESDEQVLIREVKEELGVDLITETIEYLESFTAQAAGKPEGVMVQIKCYQAEYKGNLVPTNEIGEFAWFTTADMKRTTATGQLILKYLKDKDHID